MHGVDEEPLILTLTALLLNIEKRETKSIAETTNLHVFPLARE